MLRRTVLLTPTRRQSSGMEMQISVLRSLIHFPSSYGISNQIVIHLSDEELSSLNGKVNKGRGSRERLIRCISGDTIQKAPLVDVMKLVYEVCRIGNSLNQFLCTASSINLLDLLQLRWALGHNWEVEEGIVDAYTKG